LVNEKSPDKLAFEPSGVSIVRRTARNYAVAVLAVLAATAVRFLAGGFLAEQPFVPFFLATLVVVVFAGSGPGVLATLLSVISAKYFFLAPIGSFEINDPRSLAKTAIFTVIGLASCVTAELISRRRRATGDAVLTSVKTQLRGEAMKSLQESEERYRLLFETSRDGIVTVDLSGEIQDANPAFQSMLGHTMDELWALRYQDFTPLRWHDAEQAIVRDRILARGDSGEYEKEYIHKDGSVFPVSLRAWPVLDAGGKAIGMRAFVRDITDRRRVEEALRDADRRKDEFIATLSHELRNPLAPIRNGLQVLRITGGQGPSAERAQEMMERQVEHLVRLVDDLLEVSRVSHGKIELRKERLDLAVVVDRAIDLNRELIDAAGVLLRVAPPDAPVLVDADPVRLAQIFGNLLNNAVNYTDRGGHIEVAVRRVADAAIVTVADTGVGIPKKMLPHVFDLFVQVDRTPGRDMGGLGIGLSLVRSLVELHGGEVEAHSEGEARGSRFVVRLPLTTNLEANAPPPQSGSCATASSRRVLIVDDTPEVADSFAILLETLGVQVRVAYSGAQGLAASSEFEPELVFLDIGMPGMDGFETARRMRDQPAGRKAVLVALTGWGEDEMLRRVKEAGFNRHLTKPASMGDLEALLYAAPT
jgi:PAS domain S-box-containing protein